MELMGGSITLHSAGKGMGTTVAIALPLMDLSLLPTPLPPVHSSHQEQQQRAASIGCVNEASLPEIGLSEKIEEAKVFDSVSYAAGAKADENKNGGVSCL
jgi:hypothetical protein